MRTFVIECVGQNRKIRAPGTSHEDVQRGLLIGYKVVGEVVDGVEIYPPLPDGLKRYTLMTSLLRDHGEELKEWLADAGFLLKVTEAENAENFTSFKN